VTGTNSVTVTVAFFGSDGNPLAISFTDDQSSPSARPHDR
jgi:hypothetical protein